MGENSPPPTPPPVLVVTADVALQEVLADLLREEGYAPRAVCSIREALSLVEKSAFALVVAEVFAAASPDAWDDAKRLLRRAHPAPVGLLVTQSQVPAAVSRAGFAFVQAMPFEIDELLARVATAVERPLTPQQQRWAALVERYYAGIAARDWDAVLDLCADEVVYYPPADSPVVNARRLEGKAALRRYYEGVASRYQRVTSADVIMLPRSYGLLAYHTATWLEQDERFHQAVTALRLRFAGDRIRQIGVRTSLAPLPEPVHAGT